MIAANLPDLPVVLTAAVLAFRQLWSRRRGDGPGAVLSSTSATTTARS